VLREIGLDRILANLEELGLAAIGTLLAFGGAFGPWIGATDDAFSGGSDTAYGIQLDEGKLVLLLALVAGYALIRFASGAEPLALLAVLAMGLAVGLTAIAEIVSIQEGLSSRWGLWLVGAGGLGMTLGALLVANVRSGEAWDTERRDGAQEDRER